MICADENGLVDGDRVLNDGQIDVVHQAVSRAKSLLRAGNLSVRKSHGHWLLVLRHIIHAP
jgi:hypothetical protein